ncbi:centromere protein O [Myiozetetes cayanensis]|uniref:centromere protein O n=1 Tax=Myiozetetes cayanensis TaxID=478635 RepID=UPI002160FBF0|nr:centromere protein O [Myiozetetes cayanensis]XP_050169335.1 centromere protein O [Myiozetetes cayanensis]
MELGKEEGGKQESSLGVLAQLESLERREGLEFRDQELRDRRESREFRLRSRARELRLRRDRLREKLERLEKQAPGKAGTAPDSDSDPTPPDPRDVLEWRIRSLRALLRLFHLTGISGKLSKRGVFLTLSTSYENSQLDSFHLELQALPELRIQRHSIPAFIPLERLSREFLPRDLRRFLGLLCQHLNGFVGRRFQAEQFQERFSDWIQGIPQRNSLCNLLKFRYSLARNSGNFPFQARLLYRDPCRSLPTDVAVSCSPEAPAALAAQAEQHSELFRTVALHRAFQSLTGAP